MSLPKILHQYSLLNWATLFCLFLALVIRLPEFGTLPRGLNRDEAALGYNAYALLRTGADEHGVSWPVVFSSFGDQKLPGYIYTAVPFIQIFGLTTQAVKLPSFLAGLAIIWLVGRIVQNLSRDIPLPFGEWLAPLAMLFVAVSPWGNHFSRIAYEAHLAMAWFLLGLWATLRGSAQPQNRWWLPLAALGFSLALLTYHSYQLFLPLFGGALLLLFRKEIQRSHPLALGGAISIGVLASILLLTGGIIHSNLTKNGGITPFNARSIAPSIGLWRGNIPHFGPFIRLISNSYTERARSLGRNLIDATSPSFYFTSGTGHHVHNVSGIANLHPILAPAILIGLCGLWTLRKRRAGKLLALWTFLALVPAALTIEPQHTVRAAAVFPALEILAALGTLLVISELTKKKRIIFLFLGTLTLSFVVLRSVLHYRFLSPVLDRPYAHDRYHLLAQTLQKYQGQFSALYTQEPSSSPYIWYLFETKYDPTKLQATRQEYPADAEHFVHVKAIENIHFATIQWPELEAETASNGAGLVFRPTEIPIEIRTSDRYEFIEVIRDQYGTPQYEVWRVRKAS